uniref:TMV resistance protein N-like isoform X1 n=1 Tax=Fragaria vesca subsp. vesca TaxID=101020 RepID=UPI0005CABF98|nr:PREDICTED: TMV resistance protein N-like isoform X1 [Fragaria vesca subsp. vesca]
MASTYNLRASTSSASSPSSSGQWKYDVFLSFRGEDTRKKFTDHLYDKLEWRGIKTFRDNPDLERGTTISPELLSAIEQSRFAVVVLSPNYASSKWCLLELAKIVQCMGKRGTILPIFYEVDPSDVRHQRGSFGEAFAEHDKKLSGEDWKKMQEWRDALTKVANLSGWTSNDYRYEVELIKEIVEALWQKVHPTFASSESKEHLVGIDSKLMEIDFLLDTKANDVCFLGVWGMGGIGKTTLAKLVYPRISHHFEVSIFLPDVRQVSAAQGLVHLQEKLLCHILNEKNIQVQDVDDGVAKLRRCLFNKKVLLVLDDVDQSDQLENLAGGKDWFGSGSMIIVTTRNQYLLTSHGIEKQYKSRGLNEDEALQFFSWRAFKKDKPEEVYRELSLSILEYARGLPLALKILGSSLWKRDQEDWESTVAMLRKAPINDDIFKVLRISYDGLDEVCQQVFLDIVCFFKGNDKERVIQILNSAFSFDIRIKINVLVEKSLLTTYDNCVNMHDLIQEMGEEIIRSESVGRSSRLWLLDDIFPVLKHNLGTETIRSIALHLPKSTELAWNPNAFSKMYELKFLKMQNLVLCQGPDCLPDTLRFLEWISYPSESLPPKFQPVELIELILHHSKIHQLWDGIKHMKKLIHIDLSYSENLEMTPDFTGIPNLERLILEGCTNLVKIHPSIVSLKKLKLLNFKNCRSIENLPGELEMDSLEMIDLSGCSKVNVFPQFVSRMEKLSELSFGGIGVRTSEIQCDLAGAEHSLSPVLASLKHFCCLKRLNINDCKLGEGAIPRDIGCLSSLEDLDLSVNNFVSLPASIIMLSKLKSLNLEDCKRLQQLPRLPSFSGICDVNASNCISLKKFPDPPKLCSLWKLTFNFINCCSLKDGGSCDTTRSILRRFLQEPPPFFEMFSIVMPANNIPCWAEGRSIEQSVRGAAPGSRRSKWMGFALCVLFGAEDGAEENLGALAEDHANTSLCSWKPGLFVPASFSFNRNQVVTSDHLCVLLLPSKHYPANTDFKELINSLFQGSPGLKVKKCGVHTLYKQKVEELDLRMRRYEECAFDRYGRCDGVQVQPEFSRIISGNHIPVWFKIIGKGDSVILERPCISCCSTWMGVALCVRFGAEKICDAADASERARKRCRKDSLTELLNYNFGKGLPSQAHAIWFYWSAFSRRIYSIVSSSDHLCVFFIPVYEFLGIPKRVQFELKSDACLKVKGYGVRSVYKIDLPMDLANQSLEDQLLWSINNC